MTYIYFLIVVNKLKKIRTYAAGFESTDTGVSGQRSTSYTTADSITLSINNINLDHFTTIKDRVVSFDSVSTFSDYMNLF